MMEESTGSTSAHVEGNSSGVLEVGNSRPPSTSPGPPPSKRSAGMEISVFSPSCIKGEVDKDDHKLSSTEVISGDIASMSDMGQNHPREYSTANGSYVHQQQEEMSLEHNQQPPIQSHRPSVPHHQQTSSQSQHSVSSMTPSYYTYATELTQQPPQATPTHTQHHMGWMQQQQQHLHPSQIQSVASYHDHNYNAGVHMGLPQHLTPPSAMTLTQGHSVSSASPPETSGINFYSPQSPYYGIHPQQQPHSALHQQQSPPGLPGSGTGYGQVGGNHHFSYSQLPLMQMNQNYVGGMGGQQHQQIHQSHLQQVQQQSQNKVQHSSSGMSSQHSALSLGDSMNSNGGIGANNKSPWVLNSESPYPGGLEVLWREVPEECQRVMTLQDVPETARQRGYFTVCELIALKRSLVSRMGLERRGASGMQLSQDQREQEAPPPMSEMSSVGMAVKEAMNALDEGDHANETNDGSNVQGNSSASDGGCVTDGNNKSVYSTEISSSTQGHPGTMAMSSVPKNMGTMGRHAEVGPPPPYRTATLVFKLLQIGNYQFRSFSEVNPNRLRVLFNTQRLTYECQLSVVRPPREGMPVLRKLLTVDIGFDQISVIRFGTDKLFLRVEGAPLLTVTYNPANDDLSCPPLSQQDLQLLEQIDKGQLKLSPCHQLYFLNERLVHLLEYQFKELPRFRNILQDSLNDQQQHQMQSMQSLASHQPQQ